MADNPRLVDWTSQAARDHGRKPFVVRHRLHELELFTEASLMALIDAYPRQRLQVFTMGSDPLNRSDWQPVDTTGASGRDILTAVAAGRLWVKLMRLDLVDSRFRDLVARMYREIEEASPDLRILWTRPLLLISSPGALVYYHADPQPAMLWHLGGSKRMWVYPNDDAKLLSCELLEQIYAGEIDEEAPYEPWFDERAVAFDLQPGDMLSWPINAPHRITNHDSVNVSMSIPYGTDFSERRAKVFRTNLDLRRRFGIRQLSTKDAGVGAFIKRLTGGVLARTSSASRKPFARQPYRTNLRIDASAKNGVRHIPGEPVATPF